MKCQQKHVLWASRWLLTGQDGPKEQYKDWGGVASSESLRGQQRGNGSSGLVTLTEIAV